VFEIHLGAHALTSDSASLGGFLSGSLLGPALLSALLAWSGICAQLQALTVLKPANVRFLPFAAVRLLHGLTAFALTFLLWKPLVSIRAAVLPVFTGTGSGSLEPGLGTATGIWSLFPQILSLQGLILLLLLSLSVALKLFTWRRHPSA
jgi:hypothetical protein